MKSERHSVFETVNIGGLPVSCMTRDELVHLFMDEWKRNRNRTELPRFSSSANGHVLALAAADQEFRLLLQNASHIDADGMPLVIASRYVARREIPERVATTDFIHDIARRSMETGIRFFLLGATEEENARAVAALERAYPGLAIKGHHGFFSEAEEKGVIDAINAFGTDLLWVGLGVPREHRFAVRHRAALRGVTWIKTCGGLFNFLSGSRQRAPSWLQKAGLEWLWRMAQEPGRLGPRYLTTNGKALHLMWQYRER